MGLINSKNQPVTPAKRPVADKLNFACREAYNVLRTNLTFSVPGKKLGKVIGITSPAPSEGKSTTSINMSYALAKDGHKTLIVSADMRRPGVEEYLEISETKGLSNILAGNIPEGFELKDAIFKNVFHPNLSVMVAGSIPPNPSELLGSEEMKKLLDTLSKTYEYILLDLPPVTSVIDAIAVSKYLDGMVVVVRHGYSKKQSIHAAMSQLQYANVRILGFVYNDTFQGSKYYRRSRYSRYSRYYRNKSYKNYYKSHSYSNYTSSYYSYKKEQNKSPSSDVNQNQGEEKK